MNKLAWVLRQGVGCGGLALVACSSSGSGSGSSGSAAMPDVGTCMTDPLVDTPFGPAAAASLPMTRPGKNGLLSFVLVDPMSPNPPSRDVNSWTFKVLDSKGNAIPNATISFPPPAGGLKDPWMPRMGHGSSIPSGAANGDGTYTVGDIYFSMAGVWTVVVQAQSGQMTDKATFTLCVP